MADKMDVEGAPTPIRPEVGAERRAVAASQKMLALHALREEILRKENELDGQNGSVSFWVCVIQTNPKETPSKEAVNKVAFAARLVGPIPRVHRAQLGEGSWVVALELTDIGLVTKLVEHGLNVESKTPTKVRRFLRDFSSNSPCPTVTLTGIPAKADVDRCRQELFGRFGIKRLESIERRSGIALRITVADEPAKAALLSQGSFLLGTYWVRVWDGELPKKGAKEPPSHVR
jgi:hypothetical protein